MRNRRPRRVLRIVSRSMNGWSAPVLAAGLLAGCAAPQGRQAPQAARVPATPATPKQQLTTAYQHLQQKRYDQADAEANAFLAGSSSGPGAAEAYYLKGRVFEARAEWAGSSGQSAQARAQLTTAANVYLRALSLSPVPAVEGLAHAGFGNAAFYLEDYPTAAREYTAAYPLLTQPESQAWTLYRIAVCQQRLGQFDLSDKTFAMVQKGFPKSEAANRAGQQIGRRAFYLQVGAFNSPATANGAMARLQRMGFGVSRLEDTERRQIIRAGPFTDYASARGAQVSVVSVYPDSVVVP